MDLFIKSNFVNDQRTANIWSKKLAVQCLNDPDSYRDCASYQDHWWQKVLPSVQLRGVSPKLQTLIIFILLYFKPF
jgi:hypothetical protein